MGRLVWAVLAVLTASGALDHAVAADKETLDRLVGYAKQACLIGTQFDLHADENGTLSFKNLLKPGEEVKIDTSARKSSGASAIFDQQLRVVADRQIQECMKPYIDKIFSATLGTATPLPPSTPYHLVVPKGQVALICDNQNHLTYRGPRPSLPGRFDIIVDGRGWLAMPGDQEGNAVKGPIITLMEAQGDGAVFDVRCK